MNDVFGNIDPSAIAVDSNGAVFFRDPALDAAVSAAPTGVLVPQSDNAGNCTNSGTCTGSNLDCINSGNCSGASDYGQCRNTTVGPAPG